MQDYTNNIIFFCQKFNSSCILLLPANFSGGMQITVVTPYGNITIVVKEGDTILSVKEEVS